VIKRVENFVWRRRSGTSAKPNNMRRLFGAKKEKPPPPSLDDVSSGMSTRGDTIDEKIRKLDAELLKHKEAIKKTRPGPAQEAAKQRALRVLRQRKLYEGQRDQLYQQQFNIDQVAFTTQNMKDTTETVQAMQAASKELKTQFKKNKELDIDYIEKMQDDMADLMDMSNEIQEALGRSYDVPDDLDEEELLGELDALELELATETETGEAVPSYLQDVDLPEAPSGLPEEELPADQEQPIAQKTTAS